MAKHRMTPKRRAALRKAQAASARKRRGRRNKRIAIGAGVVGTLAVGTAAGFAVHHYVKHTSSGGPARPHEITDTPVVPVKPKKRRAKVSKNPYGRSVRRHKARIRKNDRARMKYWAGKPVGGAARKPRSDKGKPRLKNG